MLKVFAYLYFTHSASLVNVWGVHSFSKANLFIVTTSNFHLVYSVHLGKLVCVYCITISTIYGSVPIHGKIPWCLLQWLITLQTATHEQFQCREYEWLKDWMQQCLQLSVLYLKLEKVVVLLKGVWARKHNVRNCNILWLPPCLSWWWDI